MFVMYCVNGTSRSSLLIESTDSMIMVRMHVIIMNITLTSLARNFTPREYYMILPCYLVFKKFIPYRACKNFDAVYTTRSPGLLIARGKFN